MDISDALGVLSTIMFLVLGVCCAGMAAWPQSRFTYWMYRGRWADYFGPDERATTRRRLWGIAGFYTLVGLGGAIGVLPFGPAWFLQIALYICGFASFALAFLPQRSRNG